jgi:hypothetical protein
MNESVTYERLLRQEIHKAFMRVAEAIADDTELDEGIAAGVPLELFSAENAVLDALREWIAAKERGE